MEILVVETSSEAGVDDDPNDLASIFVEFTTDVVFGAPCEDWVVVVVDDDVTLIVVFGMTTVFLSNLDWMLASSPELDSDSTTGFLL